MSVPLCDGWQPLDPSCRFSVAVRAYRFARAASDLLNDDDPEADCAVDAYCAVMDVLINTDAPSIAAVALKMDLASERQEDFGLIEAYWTAIRRDIARLSGGEAA